MVAHVDHVCPGDRLPASRSFLSSQICSGLPFPAFIIQAYGAVLSPLPSTDPQQGNLSRAMGSVVGTACLRAETRVAPQLISHVFGLLYARDVEGLSQEDYWLASDEGTEWVINTVDQLYDVARGDEETPSAKL